jgi:hypothetical protein
MVQGEENQLSGSVYRALRQELCVSECAATGGGTVQPFGTLPWPPERFCTHKKPV